MPLRRFVLLLSLVLFPLILAGCSEKKIEDVKIGEQAPDFSLPDQTGKTHTLSGYKGNVILVRFWTDWCPSCKEEMPKIDELYKELKGRGFMVLGINVKQGEEAVASFVKDNRISFPTPMDKDAVVAKRYGTIGLPTTFIVDKKGNVREKVMGDMTKKDIEKLVRPLL